jgi:hypothetical protein
MDNLFSSPNLFDDLRKKKINCCGTFRPNRKGIHTIGPRSQENEIEMG